MGADTIKQNEITEASLNPWLGSLFEPALLIIIITCLSISLKNLIIAFNFSWHGTYFLAGMLFVTIEAIYAYRILKKHNRIRDKRFCFRLAEWGIILLSMKAITYFDRSWDLVLADIQHWIMEPLHFITMEFAIYSFLAFLIWQITTNTMKAFDNLLDPFVRTSTSIDPFQQLIHRFYYGGAVLILISGLPQWFFHAKLGVLSDLSPPRIKGVFFNILAYFILGLILLSRTHLKLHLVQWRKEKIDVSPYLIRRWAQYGFMTLGIITLIIFLLPTKYTLGFLTSIKLLLQLGLKGIIYFIQFIWSILIFCLMWLLSLFSFKEDLFQEEFKDRPIPHEQVNIEASPWEAFNSFIFWIILLVIFVYLLRIYLKDHPGGLFKWLKTTRFRYSWLAWLGKVWQWLKGGVQSALNMLPGLVLLGTEKGETSIRRKQRWLRFGKLSARERILYYYLNTLQRAKKCGLNRQKDQTPKEYALRLNQNIPDMDAEIELLTETFVHARYSRDAFDNQQASLVKTTWQQIRRVLRKSKKTV